MDVIVSGEFGDDVVGKTFEAVNDGDRILYDSIGGSKAVGLAAYQLLKTKKGIISVAYGRLASSSTLPFLATKNRKAFPTAEFLIHYPTYAPEGTTEEIAALLPKMQEWDAQILDIYENELSISRDEIASMMQEGSSFGVEKALQIGFITEIIKGEQMKEQFRGFCKALGINFIDGKMIDVGTTDGGFVNIDSVDADSIKVGDKSTSPDGSYLLQNGKTVTIKGGVVESIEPTKQEQSATMAAGVCPSCGAVTPDGANYCPQCGFDLKSTMGCATGTEKKPAMMEAEMKAENSELKEVITQAMEVIKSQKTFIDQFSKMKVTQDLVQTTGSKTDAKDRLSSFKQNAGLE